jgi:hypothetical protein
VRAAAGRRPPPLDPGTASTGRECPGTTRRSSSLVLQRPACRPCSVARVATYVMWSRPRCERCIWTPRCRRFLMKSPRVCSRKVEASSNASGCGRGASSRLTAIPSCSLGPAPSRSAHWRLRSRVAVSALRRGDFSWRSIGFACGESCPPPAQLRGSTSARRRVSSDDRRQSHSRRPRELLAVGYASDRTRPDAVPVLARRLLAEIDAD